MCVIFVGDKGLFSCTHECGGFEIVSGLRIGQNTSGTLPWTVNEFQRRLDTVIDVKGGHIEKWGHRLILMYIYHYTV